MPAIAVFVNLSIDPANTDTYFFLIISIMLSSLLLSWRRTTAIVAALVLITTFFLLTVPALTFANLVTPLGFFIMMSGLLLVFMRYRDSLETSRKAELTVSENRWRMIINQSPFCTTFYTPDGRLKRFNQAAIDQWKLTPKDQEFMLANYNILEDEQLKAKGLLPHIRRCFGGMATTTPPMEYEFLHSEDLGSIVADNRWMLLHCYPVKDDEGEVHEVVLVHEDISERKQAEEALKRSELYFRSLIEDALDIVMVLNVNGTMRYGSSAIERVLGYTPDELSGESIFDFIHPDDLRNVQDFFAGQLQQAGLGAAQEARCRHKDGAWRVLELFGNNMVDQPAVAGIIVTAHDITKRKQAEATEARLWKMLDDSLNEIYIFNAETLRFIQVNQGAQDNVQYSMAELEQMTPLDLKPEFTSASFARLLEPLRTGEKEKIRFVTEHQRQDGSLYPVETHLQLSTLGSEPVFVAIILDITERRQTEELIRQQDRLAAVGQLAAGIAHDFNNVMAIITLYSEFLLRSPNLTEEDMQQLQTIRQQANRAADLTGQILDFSRQSVMEQRPVNLLLFLKEFTKLLQRTLPEHIKISLTHGKDSYSVHADLTRIQQAVMNLVLNARDAMPDGGELSLGLSRVLILPGESLPTQEIKAGHWVKITVSDNGTGISSDVLPYLFEPFFTTKMPGQGTGLGLAQVYGIVKRHEGHIDVESHVDLGTTFTIYLPALSLFKPEEQSSKMESWIKGQGETILIVEDNATAQTALADGFEKANYRVLTAANGRQALETIEAHRDEIALVLSDLVMPEMGGKKLLQAMKQKGIEIPVVILTGHPLGEEVELLRAEGLRAWLSKPTTLGELTQVVARILNDDKNSELG